MRTSARKNRFACRLLTDNKTQRKAPQTEVCATKSGFAFHALSDDTVAGFCQATVAAFAFLKIQQSFKKLGAREIRPERFGNINFGIGDLPEQEITDGHFPAVW